MNFMKKGLLVVICCCIFAACQQAEEQELWEETTTTLEKSKMELEKANQLSKQLVELINSNENDPRRTTYLTLLQDLKQLENSLLEWENNLQPLDSLQQSYTHDSIINYLQQEKALADSLTRDLAATVQRSKDFLSETEQ